jgi:cellulose synthase/poly-beta-1,6-N-acetylglucosamine synthase-like glycosyltransferase
MSFSLVFLNQLLSASTAATVLTLFGVFPRCVRESRLQSIILLLIVLTVGEIAAWWFHNLWLILAVLLLPVLAALIECCSWAPWACINGACLAQNVCLLLLSSAYLLWHAPNLLGFLIGAIGWMAQICWVLMTSAATFDVLNAPEPAHWPGVCIQVPAHDEPPDVLAATIKQLMQQDYPGRWMVQVIDNNTPDPRTWLPVKQLCQQLGDRVRFLHLQNWPGFKAGALNEGMLRLPSWVEIVAVVDADCLVDPPFLRATARHFVDADVAFVQTPQHYLAGTPLVYCQALKYLYESAVGLFMSSRREFNGIACAGTMLLIRRSCLEAIGGWDGDCIAEDAELSVRLLGRGWRGIYDHRSYAKGLLALDFASLKKQRFRWAFGAMHVFKKHWRTLLGFPSKEGYRLTLCQRLCFFSYGAQYFLEVTTTLFAMLLLGTSLLDALTARTLLASLQETHAVALLLFVIFFLRTLWAIRAYTGCGVDQAAGAFLCMLSLSWITAHACLSGLIHQKGVFLRTPKKRQRSRWQQALRFSTQELVLACLFLCGALLTLRCCPDAPLTVLLLGLQAGVYSSAVACAFAAEGRGASTSPFWHGSEEGSRSGREERSGPLGVA